MLGPEQYPTIILEVNGGSLEGRLRSFFTCIRPVDAIHVPMSGQDSRVEGMKQLIPLIKPVELCYEN